MSEAGEIVGMVDVLKLTYATLDQINSMSASEGEGPAWQKFWMSMGEHDTESAISGDGGSSRRPVTPGINSPDVSRRGGAHMHTTDNVFPSESASHRGESPSHSNIAASAPMPSPLPTDDTPFPFKFKAPSGRVHRLQVSPTGGMADLIPAVVAKLGNEVSAVGGVPTYDDESGGALGKDGFALSYLDNEGDTVSITTDHDLLEAIVLARQSRRDKVDLFVHNPEKPAVSATLDPHPGLAIQPPTPPESVMKQRRRLSSDEGSEAGEGRWKEKKKVVREESKEQVIKGVPNELLLPGAVAVLAIVIIGVFTMSRSNR